MKEVPMGFKGVTVMDQRIRFISEYLYGYYTAKGPCSTTIHYSLATVH